MNLDKYNHKMYADLKFSATQSEFAALVDGMRAENMNKLNKFLAKSKNLVWGREQVNGASESKDHNESRFNEYWGFGQGSVAYNIEERTYYNKRSGAEVTEYFVSKIYHDTKGNEICRSDIDGDDHEHGGPTIYSSLKSAKARANYDYQIMLAKDKLSWNYNPLIVEQGKVLVSTKQLEKQIGVKVDDVELTQVALGKNSYYVIFEVPKSSDFVQKFIENENDRYLVRKVSLKTGKAQTIHHESLDYDTALKTAEQNYQADLNKANAR